jgi:xanthine dehydrogenase YagR molybdenum-binding subunit
VVGRPVKLSITRQQMFAVGGYRTPTIQRVRLGAGRDGRLVAIAHEVVEQTSTLVEFAEQTAVATRVLYAAGSRRTAHRLARLDLPAPSWMRAPGQCPGMYALCSTPRPGLRFSSRNLVACLREGAARFGWDGRDPTPGARRDGRRLVGTGMAASTHPALRRALAGAGARRARRRRHRRAGGGGHRHRRPHGPDADRR